MTRRHSLSHTIECDRNLTPLSNARVQVTEVNPGRYRFESKLKLYRCEISSFVERFIRSRLGSPKWIVGNCSKPEGYRYD